MDYLGIIINVFTLFSVLYIFVRERITRHYTIIKKDGSRWKGSYKISELNRKRDEKSEISSKFAIKVTEFSDKVWKEI